MLLAGSRCMPALPALGGRTDPRCSATLEPRAAPSSPPWCARRDTAGQERYASLAPLYYRGAGAAAVVYDVGSERSLQRAAYWASELRRNAAGSPLLVLVGNKSDLPPAERAVGSEDAQQLADRWVLRACMSGEGGVLPSLWHAQQPCLLTLLRLPYRCGMLHLETSASTGSNVGHLFHLIAEHVAAQLNPAAMPA